MSSDQLDAKSISTVSHVTATYLFETDGRLGATDSSLQLWFNIILQEGLECLEKLVQISGHSIDQKQNRKPMLL